MSHSMPKLWATEMVMSGREPFSAGADVSDAISIALSYGFSVLLAGPALDRRTVFQGAVGEIDHLQPLLRRFVAAIGIGMELFGKGLVALFDLQGGRIGGQGQLGQRLVPLALGAPRLGGAAAAEGVDIVGDEVRPDDPGIGVP